jgi:predicted O-methyltransferase YrrM
VEARAQEVFGEYAARAEAEARLMQRLSHAAGMARRDEFLLPVGEDTAQLMSLIVKGTRPLTILEVGTSYGYSTLHLAYAAQSVGAKVLTIELAAAKSAHARDALTRAGLADHVQFAVGDALQIIGSLDGPFDFVLIDLWKDLYIRCLELITPKLSSAAFILADNMIHPEQVRETANSYRRRVRGLGFDSVLLPIGSGVEVSRKLS